MSEERLGVAPRDEDVARPQPEVTCGANLLKSHFTLVFEGDIRKFNRNPLLTDTPFGRPIIAGMGNAFAEFDEFTAVADAMLSALTEAERFLDYFVNERRDFTGGGTPKSALAQVRAAIAKAEGRS